MSTNHFSVTAVRRTITLSGLLLGSLINFSNHAAAEAGIDERPNIVVILADDLGYSDIGSYGSEISTPNLDQLARDGLRFSNFHTTASCAPTRAMLLTGVDSHRTGVANIKEALTPEQAHSPFYRGSLNHNVVTVATLLRDAGYNTSMAGKWHLGYENESLLPINRGFEKTITMPFSGGDNWTQQSYVPHYEKTLWFENGKEINVPEDFYSSKFIVDKTMEQLENNLHTNEKDRKPFFSYVSFQAVHIPIQAPKAFTEKYIGSYKDGWHVLRKNRQKAVKNLGLLSASAPMKRMPSTTDWDELSEEEKRFNDKRMAVYAGMVDAMDHHIGRLIQYLKDSGQYDNTIIMFTSDNGPAAAEVPPLWFKMLGYNNDYNTLGERYSYNTLGISFGSAAASPLGHYKFHSGEGGMRVPLIVSGAQLADSHRGNISHSKAFVKDLAPTILALAGTQHPGTQYQGRPIEASTGKNLLPIFKASTDSVYTDEDIIAYEIGGNAALIKGDYKITLNRGGTNDDRWHLYNITQDPGETERLETIEPAVFSELLSEYETYARENGVIPTPPNYHQPIQILKNGLKAKLVNSMNTPIGIFIVLIIAVIVIVPIARKTIIK
ncbi:arylsulfatase [Porticoccaceae bacterium]|nr:arylsulfatase [Porticoccaceae bacterium]MDB2594079.1 arylsulfatase [Porticoccaceae bacterium]MDC3249182.1 arylsulfatase [Porticoccaceae bacterium]|tara:strand:+ start:4382 stop:6205 length:1824 start_codon:yes stop_codon:yes gene_type:complete